MRDNPQTAPTTDTLLERAREIARLAAEQAPAIEQQRHLPDGLMQAPKDSGLLRVLQPAHWGGYECDLRTFLQVATEIAKGDFRSGREPAPPSTAQARPPCPARPVPISLWPKPPPQSRRWKD